ncbi:MAG: hypothetical protein J1E83_10465 [Lachnospiraceae bacterium]|nr:hypothetical protein [Lachnospiraceae bacterium]
MERESAVYPGLVGTLLSFGVNSSFLFKIGGKRGGVEQVGNAAELE